MTKEGLSENSAEEKIAKVRGGIHDIADQLMETFFPDDTWAFRQAAVYGGQFVEDRKTKEGHLYNLSPEGEQLTEAIYRDLAKEGKVGYIEKAYHFPDVLRAVAFGCDGFFVEKEARDSSLTKERATDYLISNARQDVTDMKGELEEFLDAEGAKAFSVKIDPEGKEFKIKDLELNKEGILAQWDASVASIFGPNPL